MTIVAPHAPSELDTVTSALTDYFHSRVRDAARYGTEYVELWRTAASTVQGGKLVRPALLLCAYATLSDSRGKQPPPSAVIDAAVAIELLHYAFVLHDDVIDGDLIRRGRPNLVGAMAGAHPGPHSETSARHWGTSSAILMGDLLLSGVYQLVAGLDTSATQRRAITSMLGTTIDETVAGEHTDVGLAHGIVPPDLGVILAMSANKTASYTVGLPLAIGAILADAGVETVRALTKAGRHLGLAFQLQDDLLSVFGDHRRHGKDAMSDLREGKVTALIAHARGTEHWQRIAPVLGRRDLTHTDVAEVRELLDRCGARQVVERQVDESLAAFDSALADSAITAAARAGIGGLAHSLRGRAA